MCSLNLLLNHTKHKYQDIRFTYFGNQVWSGRVPQLYFMQDSSLVVCKETEER